MSGKPSGAVGAEAFENPSERAGNNRSAESAGNAESTGNAVNVGSSRSAERVGNTGNPGNAESAKSVGNSGNSQSARSVARVRILDLPLGADKLYDYSIPPMLAGKVHEGTLVSVAFGGTRKRSAIVASVTDDSGFDGELKPLIEAADERFSLNGELLGLCGFLSERTFCSFGEAASAILPSGAVSELYHAKRDPVIRLYRLAPPADAQPDAAPTNIAPPADAQPDAAPSNIAPNASASFGTPNAISSNCAGGRNIPAVSVPPPAGINTSRLGKPSLRAIEILSDGVERSEEELHELAGVSAASLKTLVSRGIVLERRKELFRNPYAGRGRMPDDSPLSAEQQSAANELSSLAAEGKPCAALLFGVTGSGKTRVIKAVVNSVISRGKSVIILVPEISLTGQTVDLFCGYFGDRVAVVHSSLSEGERLDVWKRVRAGEVDVVIGTRSAIFAPLDNLGLIVIDEEQEHTYKSDMNPKYHARDVARYRAAKNNAMMLLASATPSFESFYRARSGVYRLVTLKERYGEAVLPDVIIADLKEETAKGVITPLGGTLKSEIEKNLAAGEQTILFVSRRGYNNFMSCLSCGEVITCPNCTVSLTYHREGDRDTLKCHYCGYVRSVPEKCPTCGSEHLGRKGFGTQLVAGELAALYPKARILRMDADAAGGKFSHDIILSKFRNHEADILIGTQMVTKGHNFPDVTLVGVISADAALYLDDFRATERTFSLLTQVIGRAGRSVKKGRAVLQTYTPDNETIHLAAEQDYESFFDSAIKLRRQLVFPPFCDFVLIMISGAEEPEVLSQTLKVDSRLRELLKNEYPELPMYIFGPFEAPVYKVNNIYRMRIILKCQTSKRLREMTRRLLCEFAKSRKVSVTADVNPSNL